MFRTLTRASAWILCSAFGVAVLSVPRDGQAQTTAAETARATDLFKNGKIAFSKGDLAEAERLFGQALAIRKSSDIAANLAQAELEQQKYRSAAEHFAWALANLLPSASDAQRKAVENGLARARTEVAILRLDIKPEGAEVLVGEQDVGKAPIAGSVFVEPGEVIVSVKREGFISVDKRVMAGKGTEQAVEVSLSPKADDMSAGAAPTGVGSGLEHATPRTEAGDHGASRSLVPAYAATGVALVGGVVGLVFTVKAGSQEEDADSLRDELLAYPGGCKGEAPQERCDELNDQRKSVDTSRNLGIGAFVVGGVAAVVAGYFYWDALSHRGASARRESPRYGLLPNVEIGRGTARDTAAIESVKLSLSGNF